MTPSKTASSVLKKIKEQHLKQKAKWVFLLRRSLFWILFLLSALFGAKAVALSVHMIKMADVGMLFMQQGPPPPVRMLMHAIPLFWIVFFILFTFSASWCLQHTPKGYKWTLPRILGVNILLSALLGIIFYNTGLTRAFDRQILQVLRPELSGEHFRERVWQHPDRGLLRGYVLDHINTSSFTLQSPRRRVWRVEYTSDALQRDVQLLSGVWIRLHGEEVEEGVFSAEVIVPDMPPPEGGMGFGKKGGPPRRPPPIF